VGRGGRKRPVEKRKKWAAAGPKVTEKKFLNKI
jgi:hypothetical protein